jgi:hypothetical protein
MKDRSEIIRGEYDVTDNVTVYGGYGTRSSRMDAVAGNPVLSNVNGNFEASPAWQLFNIDSRSFEAGSRGKFNTGNIGHTVGIMDIYDHPCNDRAAPLAKEIGAKVLNPDSRLVFAILFLFFKCLTAN